MKKLDKIWAPLCQGVIDWSVMKMPFKERLPNMDTPQRVYALCRLVDYRSSTKDELSDFLQPAGANKAKEQFHSVYGFAKGVLIDEDQDGKVYLKLAKEEVASIDAFRRAIANRAFHQPELMFCRFTSWYLMRGEKVFGESKKDLAVAFNREINTDQSLANIYNETNITAWQTWAAFLGFGYPHRDVIIPNVAVRLQDLIVLHQADLSRDTAIPFAEFMGWLNRSAPELDGGEINNRNKGASSLSGHQLSFGLSAGLRALHDQGKIELRYARDATDIWYLTESRSHPVPNQVSELTIKRSINEGK